MTPYCAAGPSIVRGCRPGPVRGIFLCPKTRRPNASAAQSEKGGPLEPPFPKLLFTQTQFLDQRVVPLNILFLKVCKQVATLIDHHQKAAARMVVFMVALEVIGEVADTLREDRDLNFGAARIAFGAGVVFNNFSFLLG